MIQEANLTWFYLDTDSNLVMPNYTLPCLEWIKAQDSVPTWRVFEYGSGYSSIWWRLNAKEYFAVESNKDWAKATGASHQPDKQFYIEAVKRYASEGFDCVVVDGIHRKECIEFCLPFIKSSGVLIIDNYEEPESVDDWDAVNALLEGWGKHVHRQANHTDWVTAVFQKP